MTAGRPASSRILRALDRPDPATHPARERRRCRVRASGCAPPIAASRSITWTSETAQSAPPSGMSSLAEGEALALHELHDRPSLRSIAGISISVLTGVSNQSRIGNAALSQMLLEIANAGLGVVKDRRGQRGVGRAAVNTSAKSAERAGAARRNHRNRHGGGDGRASSRSRSPVRVPSRSIDVSRISARAAVGGLARPLHRVAARGLCPLRA